MQETDVKNKNRALGGLLLPPAGFLEQKGKLSGLQAGADPKDASRAPMKYNPREIGPLSDSLRRGTQRVRRRGGFQAYGRVWRLQVP